MSYNLENVEENLLTTTPMLDYRSKKQKARGTGQSYQTIRSAVWDPESERAYIKGEGIGAIMIIR